MFLLVVFLARKCKLIVCILLGHFLSWLLNSLNYFSFLMRSCSLKKSFTLPFLHTFFYKLKVIFHSKLKQCNECNDKQEKCHIHDPLGQTHSLASNEHCFHFVLFCKIFKGGDGRTYDMWEKQWSLSAVTVGWPSGSTEWFSGNSFVVLVSLFVFKCSC